MVPGCPVLKGKEDGRPDFLIICAVFQPQTVSSLACIHTKVCQILVLFGLFIGASGLGMG